MNGVTFKATDGLSIFHSYDDFNLILNSKEIGSSEVKKNLIDIGGSDGYLDLTDFFGEPKYQNRQLKLNFTISPAINRDDFLDTYSVIQGKIHGQRMHIILDEDTDFYYAGRISVESYLNEKGVATIPVICDCDPYKMKVNETVVTETGQGSGTVILSNSRKKVVPTITATGSTTFTFDGNTYSHGAGSFVIPQIELVEGNNSIGVYSANTTTLTFTYMEGKL